MNEIVTVTTGHSLGKAEAIRRLEEGFARNHGQLRVRHALLWSAHGVSPLTLLIPCLNLPAAALYVDAGKQH